MATWREKGKYGVETSSGKNQYYVKRKDGGWTKAGKFQRIIAKSKFGK